MKKMKEVEAAEDPLKMYCPHSLPFSMLFLVDKKRKKMEKVREE